MLEFCTYTRNAAGWPELPPRLELRIHAFGGHGVGPKGEHLVTPWLANETEVDHYIDEMIHRLEVVRSEAKARLAENHP
jgi:hypothetical protein